MVKPDKKERPIKKAFYENLIALTTFALLVYIIVYQFFLIKKEEFVDWGYDIGIVTYNLSLSIIASGIFYFFGVYIPDKRRKQRVRYVINYHFDQIESNFVITYSDIKKSSSFTNAPKEFPEKLEDFKLICKEMELTSRPPDYFAGSAMVPLNNWFEYFKYNFRYDDKYLEELYKYYDFFEPETLQLMHDLSHHPLRRAINQYHLECESKEYARKFDNLSHIIHDYLITISKFKQNSWI